MAERRSSLSNHSDSSSHSSIINPPHLPDPTPPSSGSLPTVASRRLLSFSYANHHTSSRPSSSSSFIPVSFSRITRVVWQTRPTLGHSEGFP
jgi:hypothetical protein